MSKREKRDRKYWETLRPSQVEYSLVSSPSSHALEIHETVIWGRGIAIVVQGTGIIGRATWSDDDISAKHFT